VARLGGGYEIGLVGWVGLNKPVDEFGPDLVIGLADRGAEHGHGVLGACAQALHGLKRAFQHAVKGAAPAGMGGADYAGLRVSKQDRSAVGGQHA